MRSAVRVRSSALWFIEVAVQKRFDPCRRRAAFASSTIFAHTHPSGGGRRSSSHSVTLMVPLPARGLSFHYASKTGLTPRRRDCPSLLPGTPFPAELPES